MRYEIRIHNTRTGLTSQGSTFDTPKRAQRAADHWNEIAQRMGVTTLHYHVKPRTRDLLASC